MGRACACERASKRINIRLRLFRKQLGVLQCLVQCACRAGGDDDDVLRDYAFSFTFALAGCRVLVDTW